MGIHTFTFEDGSVFEIEGTKDASQEELVAKIKRGEGTRVSSFERAQRDLARAEERRAAEAAAIPAPEPEPEDTGIMSNLRRGFQAGAVGTGEMAALGLATLLDEEKELAARSRIQSIADSVSPKAGGEDDISYKIGQTFGSIAGFAAPIAATAALAPAAIPTTVAGTGIGALLGVSAAAGEASERARAAGATEEERTRAVRQAAPVGILEVAPLGRFMRSVDVPLINKLIDQLGPETVETIGQRVTSAAVTGGAEGAQEVTSEIVQNLVEQGYNPERDLFGGTGESALYGGGAGATIQFLVDAFTNSRKTGPATPPVTTAEEEARALLAEELPKTGGALPAELITQLGEIEGLTSQQAEKILLEEAAKIVDPEAEYEGPTEPVRGEMSNLSRTFVQARDKQMEEGPEFVSSRPQEVDLSELGLGALQANQELLDTRVEAKDASETKGGIAFDREKLKSRTIPIRKFDEIAREEADKAPLREGPEKPEAEDFTGFQEQLMAAIGRKKARELDGGQEPITRTEPLLLTEAKPTFKTENEVEKIDAGPTGGVSPAAALDDAGLREGVSGDQSGLGERQRPDTGTEESEAPDGEGMGSGRDDVKRVDPAKGRKPTTLDFATAAKVQQWMKSTDNPFTGAPVTLSDLKDESEELKLAENYYKRATANYDQKYGIRPDVNGLPHRRTPSAKWGGQDFVEALKEAEALGDAEMVQAVKEIDRTAIELGAVQDAGARPAEDAKRNLKELFPEYAEQIDTDVYSFVKEALDTPVDRIEPTFKPEQDLKGVTLYRGLNRKDVKDKLAPRGEYNVFASTNFDVAAGYSGSDGEVVPFTVDATEVIEFPVGRTFNKTEFDRRAKQLKKGQVLVARNVTDTGPLAEDAAATARSDVYAIGRGTSMKQQKPTKPFKLSKSERANRDVITRKYAKLLEGETDKAKRRVLIGQRERELGNLNVLGKADEKPKAVKRFTATQKAREEDFGQKIRKRWNEKRKAEKSEVVQEARRKEVTGGTVSEENRLSNKLNKAIFERLEQGEKLEGFRKYFEAYANPEAAIADAYVDAEVSSPDQLKVAPAVAKEVIKFVNKNSAASDKKVLEELKRKADVARANIESNRTIEDTLYGQRKAAKYVSLLTERGNELPVVDLETAIKAGDLDGALSLLSESKTKDVFIRNLARKFKTSLKGYGVTLKVKKDLTNEAGEAVQGLYDAPTKTIFIDSVQGVDAHTLLHEVAHALTIKVATEPKSKLKGAEKKARLQLEKTYNQAMNLLQEDNTDIPTHYGLTSLAEFASESMTNQKFRNILVKRMEGQEQTLLGRFKDALRALVGVPREVRTGDELNGLLEAVMRPDPEYVGEGQYALGSRNDVQEAAKKVGEVQRKLVKSFDREQFKYQSTDFLNNAKAAPRKTFLKLLASQGLADVASAYGFNKLGFDLDNAILKQRGSITTATENTKNVVEEVQGIFKRMGDAKVSKLNELIYSADFGATIYQVDPFLSKSEAVKQYKDKQSTDPNKTLLDIWEDQRANVRAIGSDGKRAYTVMRDHYKDQYERARSIVLKEIDALGKEAGDPEIAKKVQKDIYNKLFETNTLEVYFPLVREGNFKLSYAVKNTADKRAEYIVEMFETRAERDAVFKEVEADPLYENARKSQGDMTIEDYQSAPPTSFVFDVVNKLSSIKDKDGNKVPAQAIEEVMRLFVATLPETSFAKSLQKRKGTPGYKEDSMHALRTKGYDIAVQSQKLGAASNIRAVEKEIADQQQPEGVSERAFEDTKAELLSRAQFARQGAKNKSIEDVGRRLNQFAFIYTIGFNVSSALVNLSQIPLFVMPYLGGKYGYAETMAAIKQAGSLTMNAKNSLRDFYNIDLDGNVSIKPDPKMSDAMKQELTNIMPLVKVASERGQLISQGYIAESMGLDEASRAKRNKLSVGNLADYASGISAYMFNHAEKFNRQNTMVAAYNLHLKKLQDDPSVTMSLAEMQEAAAVEAIYMTQEANGGAYLETGPSLARESLGRVALMYKSYGLQMYYSMLKQAKRSFDRDLSPEERKEARRILVGIHGSAMFFSGVSGLPLYGAIRLLFDAFLEDDEEDFDTIVRTNIKEGWFKGPLVAATGMDTASRTALTGLLIQENKYNPSASLEENLGFYLGGPALSTVKRIQRGVQDLGNGQIERGVENLMPTAVANAYKGLVRYPRDEGVKSRRNDVIYGDMSGADYLFKTIGISSLGETQTGDKTRVMKKIDKAVNNTRTKLSRDYYIALRENDVEKHMETIKKIQKFNSRHPEASITVDSLKRSLKQHMRTTGGMYHGVTLSPIYRSPMMELGAAFQDLT